MTIFIIITSFIAILSFGYVIYKIIKGFVWSKAIILYFLLIAAVAFLLLSVLIDFTNDKLISANEDYTRVGAYGDLIGGVLNPFIAMMGVFGAGFAFYAQYYANKQVQDQFKIQQFESQFYEMLRLHKENINEMQIEGYEHFIENQKRVEKFKVTTGRKVFVTMNTELKSVYMIVKKTYKDLNESSNGFKVDEAKTKIIKKYFSLSYEIFFHGLDRFEFKKKEKHENFGEEFIEELFLELKEIRRLHLAGKLSGNNIDMKRVENYLKFDGKQSDLKMYFNYKPFSGHQSRLGHYYRHLIAIVGLVVDQKNISYEEKRKYLKTLRAQLTTFEFSMLFYNYYSGYGEKWEDKENSYLIDYRMLHNIEKDDELEDVDPIEYISKIKKDFLYKYDDKEKDPLFEVYGYESSLSTEANKIRKEG